jgi:hypothetical protein
MDAMTLRGPVLALWILAMASGCAGHEEKEGRVPAPGSTTPPVEPVEPVEPEPPAVNVKVSVASVQLQEDCPSAAPQKPAMQQEKFAGDVAPSAVMDSSARGFAAMCTQSRVQLSIESDGDQTQSFAIRAVRLKKAEGGDVLGTMSTREPTVWEDSKYQPWDESVAAGASMKVGYALGDPDWAEVEKGLGGSSWGPMYIVEIDVEIDGRIQTVASPKVPRDEPINVVT